MSGTLPPIPDPMYANITGTAWEVYGPLYGPGMFLLYLVFWMGIGVVGFIGISGLYRLISPAIVDLMNRWRRSP